MSHRGKPHIEEFLPLVQMETTTHATLRMGGFIDEQNIVRPVEVQRYSKPPGQLVGKRLEPDIRTDLFIPTEDDRKDYETVGPDGVPTVNHIRVYSIESSLYHALSGAHQIKLNEQHVDRQRERHASLQKKLTEAGYTHARNTEQFKDSIRISKAEKPSPEFAHTRLYVSSGACGALLLQRMIENGAEFSGAKVWVPDLHTRPQRFRFDTPIVNIRTHRQLQSTVRALREVANGQESLIYDDVPLLFGQAIEGLPGAYLAQSDNDMSFNGDMRYLFGSAIQQAGERIKLCAGDVVTQDTITKIAIGARAIAQQNVGSYNRNPGNHAFLAGQDIPGIIRTINS